MEERITLLLKILTDAGRVYMQYISGEREMNPEEKKANDFVTQADKEIESFLSSKILSLFPTDSIIQEEQEDVGGKSGYIWVIDPIDGTNNYARKIPDARIQVAIVNDGRIEYGVIFNPNTNELYSARLGMGAKKTDLTTGKEEVLRVSDKNMKTSMLIFTVALATKESAVNTLFERLQGNIGTLRIYGCAAVAFELIAAGKADAFITNIAKPMDMAPGAIIVTEAGGLVLDFKGNNWSLESSDILVGNAVNSEDFLKAIQ